MGSSGRAREATRPAGSSNGAYWQAPLDGRASLAALTAAGRDCLRDRRCIASQSLAQLVAMLPTAERAALNAAVPALVHLRELDGGAVRSANAGHGPVVDRIGHQGMAR